MKKIAVPIFCGLCVLLVALLHRGAKFNGSRTGNENEFVKE